MLNQELINELKDILKDDFGLSLSVEEVKQIATVFISYFDLLAKIDSLNHISEGGSQQWR
ncbi:hypothetical protein A2801_02270 [Candidatus Woesebacteria bacterium RIFCSPHIGHO2_01_FULL_41_10]|uniref:Uncharacterized protein n=1 Tax=Candidatus Woesebacteria bacterium RIFCSPHIGHO2_01_FULL_41_10 TaxID=1802500 RepID=A0A1F7YQH6_9BACT|nr:MAG: hypothetical protein A2801_02270 [Candidatus Woesebacteria bacterium RIFCSPHIGHO2_01_FULL_41_10]